jgi:hypothetical protein
MVSILPQWRNLLTRLRLFGQLPVISKLRLVKVDPVANQAECGARPEIAQQHVAIEIQLRLVALVLNMDVRRRMVVVDILTTIPKKREISGILRVPCGERLG